MKLHVLTAVLICAGAASGVHAMTVTLTPSTSSPAPAGTLVTWTAAANPAATNVWYRFRASRNGGDFSVIRDYGPVNTLNWAASGQEGTYLIEVSARNLDTGQTAATSAVFEATSRAGAGSAPVLSPTSNPMVLLYSAPPCPAGGAMQVTMVSPEGASQSTASKPCQDGVSMNFYLSGMRSVAAYQVHHTVTTSSGAADGPVLNASVSLPDLPFATYAVVQTPSGPTANQVLLHSLVLQSPVATDLDGNVIWYYPENLSYLTRPAAGGRFWGIVQDYASDPSRQVVREFDMAGLTVRETNAARVNEQLAAKGMRQIGAFHHEARSLPNGGVLVLASTERVLTGVQGDGDVDVIGDMIIVLDSNMQVTWAWDAFDHLDPARAAVLGETCSPGAGGCPPFYLATIANDWLHGNSLQFTADGNILYSARHQDWIVKIEYNNGQGTGNIIWRLGKDGDFQIDSADPNPWFSHQHDPQFERGDEAALMVFDNGNTRNATDPSANSRGQVLRIDETNRTATLAYNADLGNYAFALGAAQTLPGGNYHFEVGWLPDGSSLAVEVDASGNLVYSIHSSAPDYRSFRMRDLYTP